MKKITNPIRPKKVQKIEKGCTVEYMGTNWKETGVIGIVIKLNDCDAWVECPSGHIWQLPRSLLDIKRKTNIQVTKIERTLIL
jgi:hypothetical protein